MFVCPTVSELHFYGGCILVLNEIHPLICLYYNSDSCFKILTAKLKWSEAKVACASLAQGSSLAKIQNTGENYFVIG